MSNNSNPLFFDISIDDKMFSKNLTEIDIEKCNSSINHIKEQFAEFDNSNGTYKDSKHYLLYNLYKFVLVKNLGKVDDRPDLCKIQFVMNDNSDYLNKDFYLKSVDNKYDNYSLMKSTNFSYELISDNINDFSKPPINDDVDLDVNDNVETTDTSDSLLKRFLKYQNKCTKCFELNPEWAETQINYMLHNIERKDTIDNFAKSKKLDVQIVWDSIDYFVDLLFAPIGTKNNFFYQKSYLTKNKLKKGKNKTIVDNKGNIIDTYNSIVGSDQASIIASNKYSMDKNDIKSLNGKINAKMKKK